MVAQLWSKGPKSEGIDDSKHYSEVRLFSIVKHDYV